MRGRVRKWLGKIAPVFALVICPLEWFPVQCIASKEGVFLGVSLDYGCSGELRRPMLYPPELQARGMVSSQKTERRSVRRCGSA